MAEQVTVSGLEDEQSITSLPASPQESKYTLNSSKVEAVELEEILPAEVDDTESNQRSNFKMGMDGSFIGVIVGIILAIITLLTISGIRTIDAGHVGILKKWGQVQSSPLRAGLHVINPISSKIEEIDLRLKSVTYSSLAFSKDLQEVVTEAALQYKLNPAMVPKAIQKIGDRFAIESIIIHKAIAESLKAVTSNYAANELITSRQEVKNEIRDDVTKFIEQTTKSDGLSGLIVMTNLAITDFKFSEEFNKAIEDKVRSKQEALKAINEKERINTQAQAALLRKKAETDAKTYEIQQMATAESHRIGSIAKARAEAIRLEAEALNKNENLLKLRTIEKWDGELPTFNGGDSIPMINFDDIASIRD